MAFKTVKPKKAVNQQVGMSQARGGAGVKPSTKSGAARKAAGGKGKMNVSR
jgi:hypothetical protein